MTVLQVAVERLVAGRTATRHDHQSPSTQFRGEALGPRRIRRHGLQTRSAAGLDPVPVHSSRPQREHGVSGFLATLDLLVTLRDAPATQGEI
jgi:hypothetical protein